MRPIDMEELARQMREAVPGFRTIEASVDPQSGKTEIILTVARGSPRVDEKLAQDIGDVLAFCGINGAVDVRVRQK